MRICFIVGSFPALSETFILNQITGLLDQGHELRIYAGARSDEGVVHAEILKRDILSLVTYYNDKPFSRLARLGKFICLLPKAAATAFLPALRSLNVFRLGREALSLNMFFRVAAFLPVRDYDIVLCHFGANGLVGLQMKELGLLQGKLAVAFHAADLTAYVARHGINVYGELFKKGDKFLPISDHARNRLLELGCPAGKIRVHRMGVALAPLPVRVRGEKLRVVSVARLVEKKGIVYALGAVALLKEAGTPCQYMIIGDGPCREDLERKAKEWGIMDCVTFLGWRSSVQVDRCLNEADVLLAPSIRVENKDEEGIPVVLMEAMARGVVVISTSTGGVPELVVDGESGLLVPERDAQAIAFKLARIWNDPDSLSEVMIHARNIIKQRHDIARLNADLEQFFQDIVAGGDHGAP